MMFCKVENHSVTKLKSESLSIHVALKVLHHFLQVALSKGAVTLDFRVQNYFRLCENGQQDMMRHTRASVFNKLYILYKFKKKKTQIQHFPHSCKPFSFKVCILCIEAKGQFVISSSGQTSF